MFCGLNNMRCSLLIMRSGFIIMRCSVVHLLSVALLFLLCIVCFTLFAAHGCILKLNIYKQTTSSSVHCSYFVIRAMFNMFTC